MEMAENSLRVRAFSSSNASFSRHIFIVAYGNQHRIVPSDQVDDAKAELAKKAQENRAKGRESAATQQEKTRDLIDDRIHGKDGTESTPMTKKQNDDLSKTIKKDENGNAPSC